MGQMGSYDDATTIASTDVLLGLVGGVTKDIPMSVVTDLVLTDAAVVTGTPAVGQVPTVESIAPTVLVWGTPAASSNVMVVVTHGATAGTARPAGAAAVWWSGTVQPDNWQIPDAWFNSTNGVITGSTVAPFRGTAAVTLAAATSAASGSASASITGTVAVTLAAATSAASGTVGSSAAAVAFLQTASDETDTTTYTYSLQNLGTAASDRYIAVVAYGRRAGLTAISVTSITVGGVSATIAQQRHNAGPANSVHAVVAIAAVPTGTTGDVVVTYDQTLLRAQMALYRVTGLASATAHDTAFAERDETVGSITNVDIAMSIDVPAGGFVLAASGAPYTTTVTWTGATEDFDVQFGSSVNTVSGASLIYATTQTALAVTPRYAAWATAGEGVAVAASWS